MPSILFVCTANIYRSPLAAAFFLKKLQAEEHLCDWTVESAGTWTTPGQRLPADALAAASAFGIDLRRHRTRQVSQELLAAFDLVLVMERGHREALHIEFPALHGRIYLLSTMIAQREYDIADPARAGLSAVEFATGMAQDIEQAYSHICEFLQLQAGIPFPRRHANVTL